jgi:hypothetical protein
VKKVVPKRLEAPIEVVLPGIYMSNDKAETGDGVVWAGFSEPQPPGLVMAL